jgi:hypothetical protein
VFDLPAFNLPWLQISSSITGGLFGGVSGIIVGRLQERRDMRRSRRNVASALIGEITAVARHVETQYFATAPREDLGAPDTRYGARRHFRGERDYTPVFRSLGNRVGLLPSPLPCDVVSWYTQFAMCLEWARELHELELRRDPDSLSHANTLARRLEANLSELVEFAAPLVGRLSAL